MLKRDFTKSNKEYFKQNRILLITIGIFLLVGVLIFSIFGFNGNFEVGGYNEFSVSITEETTKDYSSHKTKINSIINSYDGKCDNVLVSGEGDNTKYIIRYLNDVDDNKILEINTLIAEELGVEVSAVDAQHVHVEGSVTGSDILYTSLAIVLILLISTIFAYIRYNGASAMSILISCVLGTLAFLSLTAILRLPVGMSYFGLLTILNVLITFFAINLFETMHKSSWLVSNDYKNALEVGVEKTKFRVFVISCALMLIGVMLLLLSPITIKYIASSIMFMSVVLLAVGLYVIPFVWSVFITRCRQREYKVKSTK